MRRIAKKSALSNSIDKVINAHKDYISENADYVEVIKVVTTTGGVLWFAVENDVTDLNKLVAAIKALPRVMSVQYTA